MVKARSPPPPHARWKWGICSFISAAALAELGIHAFERKAQRAPSEAAVGAAVREGGHSRELHKLELPFKHSLACFNKQLLGLPPRQHPAGARPRRTTVLKQPCEHISPRFHRFHISMSRRYVSRFANRLSCARRPCTLANAADH